MATLYIAEYTGFGQTGQSDTVDVLQVPPTNEQLITIGVAAANVSLLTSTRVIQLSCDATCSVAFGTAAVATTANMRLNANERRNFVVPPIGTFAAPFKVSTIVNV
jgi:hypothetical protein